MKNLFAQALSLMAEQKPFALATIVKQQGSAPRGVGAKMIITEDSIYGTVGGGGMEGHAMSLTRTEVLKNFKPVLRYYNLNAKEAQVGDFICGGDAEVLIYYVNPADAMLRAVFQAAVDCEAAGTPCWLVYVAAEKDGELALQVALCTAQGVLAGNFHGDEHVAQEMLKNPVRIAIHAEEDGAPRYLVDQLNAGGRMYLFGGGHVSLEVALIAARMDFHIVVLDDREEFANPERFPGCETMVVEDFKQMPPLPVDDNTYILIITRGHAHDRTVLEWALTKEPYYTGMIGSRHKVAKVYESLRQEGADDARIAQVHSPIGLDIGAQTPVEIAVSIMGEIIQEKARRNQDGNRPCPA